MQFQTSGCIILEDETMYTEDRRMSEEKYNEDLWENHYHIGVEKVDEQHDKLFSIARRIAKREFDSCISKKPL